MLADDAALPVKSKKMRLQGGFTKKSTPKIPKLSSADSETSLATTTNKPQPDQSTTTSTNRLVSPDTAKSFTRGRPLQDAPDMVKCHHCRRAILKHRAKSHVEDCIAKKQEKQRRKKEAKDARDADRRRAEREETSSEEEEDDDKAAGGNKTARKTDGSGGDALAAGKKRKADDMVGPNGEGPSKKKKKTKKEEQVQPVSYTHLTLPTKRIV